MRARKPIRAALMLLVALVGAGVLGTPASAGPFQTGMIPTDDESPVSPLAMQRIKDAGNTYAKVTASWVSIAPGGESSEKPASLVATDPASPGYDWTLLDKEVRNIASAGLTPLVTVTSSPRWARIQGCTDQSICAANPQAYADFGTAIARRYSGSFDPGTGTLPKVRYFQAWGEANLFLYFLPQFEGGQKVSPDNYRGMLNAFSGAVKSVDPSDQIVSAGLAPLKRPGGLGPLDFMRRLLCMRGHKHPRPQAGCNATAQFDIAATHPYTTGGPTHKAAGADDLMIGNLPEMNRLIKAATRAGKIQTDNSSVPFWVTEFSWDSRPPDPGGLKKRIFARWIDEGFYRMWRAGVDTVFWFGIRDQDTKNGIGDTAQSGLWLRGPTVEQDKPKTRAIKAYTFPFVALKSGKKIRVWGRTSDSGPGKIRIEQNSGHGFHKIAKLKAGTDGIFTRKLRSRSLTGSLRAKEKGGPTSVPFSLHYVKDFYLSPFGGKGQTPGTGVGRLFGVPLF